ncbi:MAG: SpoIID/LytB domain-containing protein [Candidatus Riflebacteria bacterium]|nr:SpoIID/LytB domain-containing protein [Candidatus Riflebacteria bacterium]
MADKSYLDTPRIIRIGLDLVGSPEKSYITTSNGIIVITDNSLKKILFKGKASKLTITAKSGGKMLLEINENSFMASGSVRIGNNSSRSETITLTPTPKKARTYRGNLEVRCSGQRLYWVSVVDIEDYLKSVVPSEISTRAPMAAIEAQAIAARTYAIRNIDRHTKKENYNLCDTVHCQAYLGILKEDQQPNIAIKATEGKILVYDSVPANTVYHSNCGGYIISSQTAWGGQPVPYLIGHYDGIKGKKSFCEYGKSYLSRQNNLTLPEKTNRLVIGVTAGNSKKKTHSNYGHRVGMCQDGAIGMALIGYSCSNILGFYYPRTKVETLKYAAKNTSNKFAPTQVTSLEELRARSNKKLKQPPELKELPNPKQQPATSTANIVVAKTDTTTKTEIKPVDKSSIEADSKTNKQKEPETKVVSAVTTEVPSKEASVNKEVVAKAETKEKSKDDKNKAGSTVNNKADVKTEVAMLPNSGKKAENSKMTNNTKEEQGNTKLKGVLKQISNTKPNSTFTAIRKTFWRPVAPSIFTSSK